MVDGTVRIKEGSTGTSVKAILQRIPPVTRPENHSVFPGFLFLWPPPIPPPNNRPHPHLAKLRRWFLPLSLLGGVLLWQVVVMLAGLPAFILPSPLDVARRFFDTLQDGRLLLHTAVTLGEVLLGLLAGGSCRHPDRLRAGQIAQR